MSLRHNRSSAYLGSSLFENLTRQSILIIGAGAVGNEVIKHLALLGGQNWITIVDDDKVEDSNRNRCIFFTPSSIGRYKVDAIKETLSLLCIDMNIKAYPDRIEDISSKIFDIDTCFIAIDNDYTRFLINLILLSIKDKPLTIDGAFGRDFVEVRVHPNTDSACLCCSFSEVYKESLLKEHVRAHCNDFVSSTMQEFPAISTLNSLVASLMVSEWMKCASNDTKEGYSLRLGINDYTFNKLKLIRNPKCVEPLCRSRNG